MSVHTSVTRLFSMFIEESTVVAQTGAAVVVPHGRVAERREAARRGFPRQRLPRARLPRAQRLQALQARRPRLPTAPSPAQGVRGGGHLHIRRSPVLNLNGTNLWRIVVRDSLVSYSRLMSARMSDLEWGNGPIWYSCRIAFAWCSHSFKWKRGTQPECLLSRKIDLWNECRPVRCGTGMWASRE